ncbi:hypothetical protein AYM39_22475 (plasmid) [Methylomonas sp. DH-1]|nr:hypothetical protein AYM39_22475 [Methylomonas sp. DH-1]
MHRIEHLVMGRIMRKSKSNYLLVGNMLASNLTRSAVYNDVVSRWLAIVFVFYFGLHVNNPKKNLKQPTVRPKDPQQNL